MNGKMRCPRMTTTKAARVLHGDEPGGCYGAAGMDSGAEEITRFVEAARAYCRFVQDAGAYPPAARLRAAAQQLATLYAASLSLPDPEPLPDVSEPSVERPRWAGFDDYDAYWEVYDPLKMEADSVVCGSLSDDILDVYSDVASGLALFDDGHVANAVWHWRFTRGVHWGDHAVDALRALQRAIQR